MMDNIEVFRLSAQACGYAVSHDSQTTYILARRDEYLYEWNPFTDAKQRWQCIEKLLEMGYGMRIGFAGDDYHDLINPRSDEFNCPASEFPARALAALREKK